MKSIVMPPFEAVLHPASKAIIGPIADLIPEPLQEFIDINQVRVLLSLVQRDGAESGAGGGDGWRGARGVMTRTRRQRVCALRFPRNVYQYKY